MPTEIEESPHSPRHLAALEGLGNVEQGFTIFVDEGEEEANQIPGLPGNGSFDIWQDNEPDEKLPNNADHLSQLTIAKERTREHRHRFVYAQDDGYLSGDGIPIEGMKARYINQTSIGTGFIIISDGTQITGFFLPNCDNIYLESEEVFLQATRIGRDANAMAYPKRGLELGIGSWRITSLYKSVFFNWIDIHINPRGFTVEDTSSEQDQMPKQLLSVQGPAITPNDENVERNGGSCRFEILPCNTYGHSTGRVPVIPHNMRQLVVRTRREKAVNQPREEKEGLQSQESYKVDYLNTAYCSGPEEASVDCMVSFLGDKRVTMRSRLIGEDDPVSKTISWAQDLELLKKIKEIENGGIVKTNNYIASLLGCDARFQTLFLVEHSPFLLNNIDERGYFTAPMSMGREICYSISAALSFLYRHFERSHLAVVPHNIVMERGKCVLICAGMSGEKQPTAYYPYEDIGHLQHPGVDLFALAVIALFTFKRIPVPTADDVEGHTSKAKAAWRASVDQKSQGRPRITKGINKRKLRKPGRSTQLVIGAKEREGKMIQCVLL